MSRTTAITRAVERASPAVVSISVTQVQQVRARDPFWDTWMEFMYGRQRTQLMQRQVQSAGSGFIISADGYVVTNEHVAAGATQIAIALPDGTTFDARLVGTDTATDLALLKVDTDVPLPYVEFDLASEPIVGEWVIALGNPFGLFEATDPSVTVGVVSATNRDLTPQGNRFYLDMIQTDAAINRGNSGGPLLNALGRVIGVNTAIYSESGGSIGIGFAVPAQRVHRVLEELRENGFVDRSYFTGLSGRSVTAQIAQALGMDAARGVFVEEVESGSPASDAGFQPYDVIQFLEGERVSTRDEFVARLFEYRPGDTVQITVLRQAEWVDLTLTIGSSR
ncbi:MAG: trypsin-like peptidase domain-containing protein [Rhodothermales bacterium]